MSETPEEPREDDTGSQIKGLFSNRTPFEVKIIATVLLGTFIVPIAFLISTVFFEALFPTTTVTLILGIFAGVVIYVFVDPQTESKFTLGGLTLGGAAAFIFLVPYFFSDQINFEMNKSFRDAQLAEENEKLESDIDDLQERLDKIKNLAEASPTQGSPSNSQVEQALRNATPDTDLGKSVLELLRRREGPFDATVGDVKAIAAFNGRIPNGSFDYCKTSRPEMQAPIRFSRVVDGEIVGSIELDFRTDIGTRNCEQVGYEVKLGCDAAEALLTPEEFKSCDARRGVLWNNNSERRFDVNATILNPEIMLRN